MLHDGRGGGGGLPLPEFVCWFRGSQGAGERGSRSTSRAMCVGKEELEQAKRVSVAAAREELNSVPAVPR